MTGLLGGDPRAQAIVAAAWRLYQELEPGDAIAGITLTVESAGQLITYGIQADRAEVQRYVTDLSDLDALADAVAAVRAEHGDALFADATPPNDLAGGEAA